MSIKFWTREDEVGLGEIQRRTGVDRSRAVHLYRRSWDGSSWTCNIERALAAVKSPKRRKPKPKPGLTPAGPEQLRFDFRDGQN
jgi:hypothetical protein